MKESIDVTNLNEDLVTAARYGVYKLVELLLDAGADVHYNNDDALHVASSNGHYDVVKLLLYRGADIHAYEDLALHCASKYGHYDVVKLLLDRGADPMKVGLNFVHDKEIRELIVNRRG